MITDKELQEIKARVNNTTATPWVYENIGNTCIINSENIYVGEMAIEEDAEFISWARTDISKLINEIERLRALNRWIPVKERLPNNEECNKFDNMHPNSRKFLCIIKIGEYEPQTRVLFFSDIFGWMYGPEDYNEHVLAWQILPEPLKEDDNNE